MTLEDFERALVEERMATGHKSPRHDHERSRKHRRRKHPHHPEVREQQHEKKRGKLSGEFRERRKLLSGDRKHRSSKSPTLTDNCQTEAATLSHANDIEHPSPPKQKAQIQRDSWMEQPQALDIECIQRSVKNPPEPTTSTSSGADFQLKIHENELNKQHLQYLAERVEESSDATDGPAQDGVDYTFGDAGAQWRMTRLKGVYRRAREEGRPVEDVAKEQYGDLKAFDDSREEHTELERRVTYGEGYIGKEKPSGELFEERRLNAPTEGLQSVEDHVSSGEVQVLTPLHAKTPIRPTIPMDQTALNRLKARMLKAKVRGGSEAVNLTAEYNRAIASFANQKQADIVVLGTMDSRMLASGRRGEVKAIENKRGRERGLVEANEDMTVDDMVREERRTRGQDGGDGRRFAERIAKDARFENDLDYMDENATKLAKRVQKSEINLKNTAISDFQRMNRVLDTCPLCHHEDTNTPPVAPIISLATRVYLTLPTEPEISDGGACIIPVQHHRNLLECDDDEWEEIRNFMKSLTRMYHDQGRDVIFYENAAASQRKRHAGMEAVPLPYNLGDTAPAFFKEAILTTDEEWAQHKKIIDTLGKARNGLGRLAFRRSLVKEMPYFHVWFEMDGGFGHVVEDSDRWPKGDLFAREVIGGMLDKGPDIVKRQGKWSKGGDPRVDGFRKRWKKFDWTRVLTDG
ncbi:MAG: hypothetical protein Q9163_000900 [Psora crenata]